MLDAKTDSVFPTKALESVKAKRLIGVKGFTTIGTMIDLNTRFTWSGDGNTIETVYFELCNPGKAIPYRLPVIIWAIKDILECDNRF